MARKLAVSREQTLEEIMDAAFKLFGRFGLPGVSIAQIASEAGLSKAAMYWHFENKEQLYIACLQRLYMLMDECIFARMQESDEPAEQLELFFTGIATLMEHPKMQGIAGYWLDVNEDERPDIHDVRIAAEKKQVDALASVMANAEKAGILSFEQDTARLAASFMAVMQATILPMRLRETDENQQTLDVLKMTFFRAFSKPN